MPVAKGMSGKAKEVSNIARFLSSEGRKILVISLSDEVRRNKERYYEEHEIPDITRRMPLLRTFNLPSLVLSGIWLTTLLAGKNHGITGELERFNPDIIISENFVFADLVERHLKDHPIPVISVFDSYRVIYSFASRISALHEKHLPDASGLREKMAKRYIEYNMKLYEKMLSLSDMTVFPTEKDKKEVARRFPALTNRLFHSHAHFAEPHRTPKIKSGIGKILFIGAYDHQPNRDAMMHIEHEIAPQVPAKEFIIVGKGCPVKQEANVRYIGEAKDLDSIVDDADLCIAPLTEGSGFKVKVLDYLSRGKAIIGTSIAFEGYGVKNGINAIVEDSISRFPERIAELDSDGAKFSKIQKGSLSLAKGFSYQKTRDRWNALLGMALKRKQKPKVTN